MTYAFLVVLAISASVSASDLFCQDSSKCNKESKRCEIPNGEQWCCNKKALTCDKNSQCGFLSTYIPFILLRPGTIELESSLKHVEDKIIFSKTSNPKIKYDSTNYLLSYHCERIDSKKMSKALKFGKQNLEVPKLNATDINCPGRAQRCPPENTCCRIADDKYGCCRYSQAVCCPDFIHCCPPDTVCNTETMQCTNANTARRMDLLF